MWKMLSELLGKRAEPSNEDSGKTARIQQRLSKFGDRMEWKNEFGEFDEAAYSRFKKEAGTVLPEDYEAYLRAFNGGLPLDVKHDFGFLFSMQNQEMEASLLSTLHWPLPPGKTNWLPIGRDGAMGLYFMSLEKLDFGSIYFCFAFSDAVTGSMSFMPNLRRTANSFLDMFR